MLESLFLSYALHLSAAPAQVVCLGVLENTLFDESASAQMILARKQAIAVMGASRLVIRTVACSDADSLCKARIVSSK